MDRMSEFFVLTSKNCFAVIIPLRDILQILVSTGLGNLRYEDVDFSLLYGERRLKCQKLDVPL